MLTDIQTPFLWTPLVPIKLLSQIPNILDDSLENGCAVCIDSVSVAISNIVMEQQLLLPHMDSDKELVSSPPSSMLPMAHQHRHYSNHVRVYVVCASMCMWPTPVYAVAFAVSLCASCVCRAFVRHTTILILSENSACQVPICAVAAWWFDTPHQKVVPRSRIPRRPPIFLKQREHPMSGHRPGMVNKQKAQQRNTTNKQIKQCMWFYYFVSVFIFVVDCVVSLFYILCFIF